METGMRRGEGTMRVCRGRFLSASAASAWAAILRRPAEAAEFNYKYGLVIPSTAPGTVRSIEACANILRDSGGRLQIDVYPQSQLGGSDQILGLVRLGAVQLSLPPDSDLSAIAPVAGMTAIPFLVANRNAALGILTGAFESYVRASVAKSGLVQFPGSWDAGFRQIQNSVRPITTPADLKGLKLRSSSATVEVAMWHAFGVTPAYTPASGIYTALQTHLVDGATITLDFVEALKLYEVTKYFSYTYHLWAGQTLVANPDAWQRLPKNLQDLVSRHFETARNRTNEDAAKALGTAEERLKAKGMQFNNADVAALRKTVKDDGLYAQWKTLYPAEAWTLLEKSVRTLGA